MNHRIASFLGFAGSVAAASLAAALVTGNALAEGPIEQPAPFVGSRTRAEVQAEVLQGRAQLSSYGGEWKHQQQAALQASSGYTRQQAQAEYLAAREEVRAMTAEHGGSGYFAHVPMRTRPTMIAGEAR